MQTKATIAQTKIFLRNLQAWMARKDVSKADLARLIGAERPAVSKLFRPNRASSLHEMTTFAKAIDVPLHELLGTIAFYGGSVSAGSGIDDPGQSKGVFNLAALIPNGATAYLVKGDSMTEEHILDGDYIFVLPAETHPPAIGDVVVVFVPDMGTLVKVKVKGGYIGSAPGAKLIPWVEGCHEHGVFAGSVRPPQNVKKKKGRK